MRNFRSRDNVGLADCLEGVDSASILLHDLHDLAETTLTHNLEQVEVFQLQTALLVFHKRDTDLDRTGSKLQVQPFGTLLAQLTPLLLVSDGSLLVVLLAQLGVLDVGLGLFETRVNLACAQEDIFTPSGARPGCRVAQVQLHVQLGFPRHIELEGCVVASPQRALGSARHRIHEDLVLFEIEEGVRKVLGRIATMDSGGGVDSPACGLRSARLHKRARLVLSRVRRGGGTWA